MGTPLSTLSETGVKLISNPVPVHNIPLTDVERSILTMILSDIQYYNNKENSGKLSYTCKTFLSDSELETASGILAKLLK